VINEFFDKVIQKRGLESMSELGAYIPGSVNRVLDSIHHPYPKSEILPYINYNECQGTYYNDGDSIGFVYEVAPSVSLDEVALRQLKGFLQDQLPDGSHMQVLLLASDKIESQLVRWFEGKQNDSLLNSLWQKRADYFKEISKFQSSEAKFKVRDFRLFLSFSSGKRGRSIFELEEEIKVLQMQVRSLLDVLSIPFISLKPKGLIDLLDELLNYKRSEQGSQKPYDKLKPIAAQLSRMDSITGIGINEINLDAGKYFTKCYSVDKFPENVPPNCTNFLLGDQLRDGLNLPCRFFISYSIGATINSSKKQMMISKGNAARRNAESFVTKFNPRIRNEALEWRDVIDRLESGERFFTTCFQVAITDQSNNITYSEQILKNIFSSRGWAISEDKFFHLPALMGMLPMAQGAGYADIYKYFEHSKTSLVEEALSMLPLTSEWKGTESSGMLLVCPRGQLMQWDPFSGGSKNYNVAVVAPSGSGKSVFLEELLLNMRSKGAQVFIVDIGRSYEKIAARVGGDFIQFDPNNPTCLNPFTHIKSDEKDDIDNTLEFIKDLVCIMASPSISLSSLEEALISEAVSTVWTNYKNDGDIEKVAEALLSEGSVEAKNLAKMLYPFTRKGSFGKFFIGKATIDFKKSFIVLEFEQILSKKGLLPVILLIAMNIVAQRFATGTRDRKLCFAIDELHKFLELPHGAKAVNMSSRIFRKYTAALIMATQSYTTDFDSSPAAKAIWNNCYWHVFLPTGNSEAESTLKDDVKTILPALKMVPGQYSEVLIEADEVRVVARLALDKYSQILYSTKGSEFEAIKRLTVQGYNMDQAIKIYLKQTATIKKLSEISKGKEYEKRNSV
jgi:conjugal transfer ATP-binding protein TraC